MLMNLELYALAASVAGTVCTAVVCVYALMQNARANWKATYALERMLEHSLTALCSRHAEEQRLQVALANVHARERIEEDRQAEQEEHKEAVADAMGLTNKQGPEVVMYGAD